jgi:hypothetical protein
MKTNLLKNTLIGLLLATNLATLIALWPSRPAAEAVPPQPTFEPHGIYIPMNGGPHILESKMVIQGGDTFPQRKTDGRWIIQQGETFKALISYGYYPPHTYGRDPDTYPEFIGHGVSVASHSPFFATLELDTDTITLDAGATLTRVPLHAVIRHAISETELRDCAIDTAIWVYK